MKNFNHINVALAAGLFTLTASFALADATGTAGGARDRDARREQSILIQMPAPQEPGIGEEGQAPSHEAIDLEHIDSSRDEKDYVAAPKEGDLDGNGRVDVDDFLLLMQDWGTCNGAEKLLGDIAPTGGDCSVDVDDLLTLVNNWDG